MQEPPGPLRLSPSPGDEEVVSSHDPTPRKGADSPWASIRVFWLVAGLLSLLLFGLIPVIHNGFIALPDEGVYSAQAAALADGSWEAPRPAPNVDFDGHFDPVGPTAIEGANNIPYGRHPLYGLTLAVFYKAFGQIGMLAFSVLGCIGAAIATGLIARRLNPIYGIPALLLAGLGSPLLFNSYIVSAHNVSTGLAGLVILLALSFKQRGSRWILLFLAGTALLVPCLRSEGSIFVGAVALAFVTTGVPIPKVRNAHWNSFVAGITIGIAGIAGYLIDLYASNTIYLFSDFRTDPLKAFGSEHSGPLAAAFTALIQPWTVGFQATIPGLALFASITLSALVLRLAPKFQLLPLALVGLAAVFSIWWQFTELALVTGLVATMPVLVFAAFWITGLDLKDPVVAPLALTSAASLIGLLGTIYGDGGAAQWGGRLIQVVLPAVIPLAVLGLHNASRLLAPRRAQFAAVCLITTVISTSVYSLRANSSARAASKDLVEFTTEFLNRQESHDDAEERTLTLLATGMSDGTGRTFWHVDTDINLLRGQFSASYLLIERAEKAGYDRVVLITDAPDDALSKADKKWRDKITFRRSDSFGAAFGRRFFVFSKPEG